MATVALDYSRSGHGRPLLLIHGITENRHSFDPLLPLLEPHFDIVAVDLRGHGLSPAAEPYELALMAADVAEVAAAVWPGVEPLVIGHSLGGIVASILRKHYPVAGVINVDQVLQLAAMQDGVKAIDELLRGPACDQVIRGMFGSFYGALPASEVERLDALRRVDQPVVLGVWSPLLDQDRAGLDAAIVDYFTTTTGGPYLALHGVDLPPGYEQWLEPLTGPAVVEVWPDLGHYPHLVEPDRFVARVLEFAESV